MRQEKTLLSRLLYFLSCCWLSSLIALDGIPATALAEVLEGARESDTIHLLDDDVEVTSLHTESVQELSLDNISVLETNLGHLDDDTTSCHSDAQELGNDIGEGQILRVEESDEQAGILSASSSVVASGIWGTCAWDVDVDGKLTVHPGRGANMVGEIEALQGKSFQGYRFKGQPWWTVADEIRAVVFEKGVVLPENCKGLLCGLKYMTSVDMSGCDTSNVKIMKGMFQQYENSLVSMNLAGWNTSRVTDMSNMFCCCKAIDKSVQSFNVSSVTNMEGMFNSVTISGELDLTGWDVSKVTTMSHMFSCAHIDLLNVTGWKASSVIDVEGMFEGQQTSGVKAVVAPNVDFSSCTDLSDLFFWSVCQKANLAGWKVQKVTDVSGLFRSCYELKEVDVSGWDTSQVQYMMDVFNGCRSLVSLDSLGWDTSSVKRFSGMFEDCSSLTQLDLTQWDTSCAETTNVGMGGFRNMFSGCSSLTELDLSSFNTSRLTALDYVFSGCTSLVRLDLSSWDTSAVTRAVKMFDGCTSLSEIKVGPLYSTGAGGTNPVFPDASSQNGKWWSTRSGAWYSKDEIVSSRSRIADTYTAFEGYDIALATVTVPEGSYTGNPVTPNPIVIYKGATLTKGTDYEVSYKSNVNAGTAEATVRGRGRYVGTKKATFTISAKNIGSCSVALSPTSYTYDGNQKNPTVTVKDGSQTLKGGADYTVAAPSGRTNAGTYTYTVTGKGNYTGTKSASYTIAAASLSGATVVSIADQTYTGSAIKPTPAVTMGGRTLANGTDYTLTYKNNTAVGTATVTVTGRGNYTGGKSATFKIVTKKATPTLTLSKTSFTYNGSVQRPTATVKVGGTTLREGTDYDLSWSPSGYTDAGTYTVKATLKGNYSGSATATFTISPKSLSSCAVTFSPSTYTYDGTQKTPTLTVKDGSRALASGTDYTTTAPGGRTDAGTYTYTVTGKGNYTGTKTASFSISQATPTLRFASSSVAKKTTDVPFTNALTKTTDGAVTFESSNAAVATVNSSTGQVTIKGAGKATITTKAAAGKNYKAGSAAYTLTVTRPSADYTVSYDANGGTGTPSPQTKEEGVTLMLSSAKPSKSYVISYNAAGGSVSPASKGVSCTFKSWNTQKGGGGTSYAPGASYTVNANATLYAQWANPVAGSLATPTRSGYSFSGWYTSATGGSKVSASTAVAGNMTLYAHWTDPYNMGDETYSFENYWDTDSPLGHCFGMSMTSAGYHNNLIDITRVGGSAGSPLYNLKLTQAVKRPICYYQKIQGSYSAKAIVAGGSGYLTDTYNIASDWQAVVNYVRNHGYDGTGLLQIGFRKDGDGGHAINFLRYESVGGQDRIYAYDNNFPDRETYFYRDPSGRVLQAPVQTFSGAIDCIALRDVRTYFNSVGDFNATHVIYMQKDAATVQGHGCTYMETGRPGVEYVMYEIPSGEDRVTIVPKRDNADFVYMDTEYSFGVVTDETRGELRFASMDEHGVLSDESFTIYEASSAIPSVALSADTYTYDGSEHRPKVTVKVDGSLLKEGNDYAVEYPSDLISAGRYEVKVTLQGKYSGTVAKAFTIHKATQTVTASNQTVEAGKTVGLGAKTSGDGKLTYKSSDTSVATVSAKGVVTGVSAGVVKVTVTAAETGNWNKATKTVSVTVTQPAPSFSDVTDKTAHADDISWLAQSGISKGWDMPDGTVQFRPYANVARADMAAFLFRLAKSWGRVDDSWQPTAAQKRAFSDVTDKTPHAREIWWLASAGISNGTKVGSVYEFRPYENVIRRDMAAFLFRLARLDGRGGASASWSTTEAQRAAFRDVTPSTIHATSVWWLASVKVSEGWAVNGGREFRPAANVARADMAAFLHRLDGLK